MTMYEPLFKQPRFKTIPHKTPIAVSERAVKC